MDTTLLDEPTRLLDLPPQPLGPQALTELRTASRRLTKHTPRGKGESPTGYRSGLRSRNDL